MSDKIEQLLNEISKSLKNEMFVKLTLGKYRGNEPGLRKISARLLETKKGIRLAFVYSYDTRETAKNFEISESIEILRGLIGKEFLAGHLFTTVGDLQFEMDKNGKTRLSTSKAMFTVKPETTHDREKTRFVDKNRSYLKALGITTDKGEIKDKQQDKWRQINKFVETMASLFDSSLLKDRKELRIVDMGCGKGYLTFAVYDYFTNVRGLKVKVTGVDTKTDIVEFCNELAKTCGFNDLHFENGWIGDYRLPETDILIALHACDTATDDAIFKGIKANADLIVAAPCCHQEIRPQIKSPEMFSGILRHGIMLERTAETITDGLRSLLLEKSGYSTKLFEFISVEHTPKNNMLAATRLEKVKNRDLAARQISEIKAFYSIQHQRLENLLNDSE